MTNTYPTTLSTGVVVSGFTQAAHFQFASRVDPSVIVIHRMEVPLRAGMARVVGLGFSSPAARVASAHYGVDPEQVWQYVHEHDIAFGAPGLNSCGIHIEHAGYSAQDDWGTPDGEAMLRASAQLAADICSRNGVQCKWLSADEICSAHAGDVTVRGFCTHADATTALRTYGGHTDPGTAFPREAYMQLVKSFLFDLDPANTHTP